MGGTALLLTLFVAGGEPAWVTRGSGAFPSDKRNFYGVGVANGIKNPALLRTTADNRARAELGKVFETFSASLMKDYMHSSGEQNVEQAIKTFSATTVNGAEIVDRYRNSEGVQYSLCRIDLERAKGLVEEAKASGAFKSHVKKNIDKVYDDLQGMMKKPPPQQAEVAKAPPPTSGGAKGAAPPPKEASSGAKTRTGGRPVWVDNKEDPSYPWRSYLYAVGFGRDRTAGENGAYAGLSKIFETKVAQVAKDFQASYSSSDAKNLELQSSEVMTRTSTSKALSGVRIAEIWQDTGTQTVYAIAVIERAKAVDAIRDHIAELDGKAKSALEKAAPDDKVKQLRHLNQALAAIHERELLNTDLRIIDADGVGVPGDFNYADVYSKLEGAQEALNVGIVVTGTQGDDVRAALAQGLTGLGYMVKEVKSGSDDEDEDDDGSGRVSGDFDLLIVGKVRIEKVGKVQDFEMVRAVADFQLKNVKKNKTIDELQVYQKEGHKTVQEAQRRAIRELNKTVAPKIADRFQKYLTRK